MTPPTREPTGFPNLDDFMDGGSYYSLPMLRDELSKVLARHERIVDERDALLLRGKAGDDYLAHTAAERDTLRARLAACKRDLNYIRRVTVGAVGSDKLAATCKTIGEYRYVLLKAINAMDIAAVAAETQGEA